MKNLLIETNLFEGKINEDASGRTLVKGVLQRAIAENQNGRVYPKEILMREAKKYETLIKERRALGELDHPDSSVINLKNVSHNVREIWWEGDDLCGTDLLDYAGVEHLQQRLQAISTAAADTRLVLLCFEPLAEPGDWCHRTMFAKWWEGATGDAVTEIGRTSAADQGSLW